MTRDLGGFREFAAARLEHLRRTAYLLCGDWHTADDLASNTLLKLLRHWRRVVEMDHPDAYARRVLVRAWLDERRRPWRREQSWAQPPDLTASGADPGLDRVALLSQLAKLPHRRRAVLVLRYFCDLSVDQTATVLGISPGTVKSQTARGLEALRATLREPLNFSPKERA